MEVSAKTVARVLASSDMQPTQVGNNDLHGIEPNLLAKISDGFLQVATCMDNHMTCLAPKVDSELKLYEDDDNGLKEANKEVGPTVTWPNKQVAKWTRLNRMEVGPNELNNPTSMLTLRKRLVEVALDVNYAEGAAIFSQKCFKVGSSDGDLDIIVTGVVDHPYRE